MAVVFSLAAHFSAKPREIEIYGVAEAAETIVPAKVSGRMAEIYVKEGDVVKAGDILVTLDAPELLHSILRASWQPLYAASGSTASQGGDALADYIAEALTYGAYATVSSYLEDTILTSPVNGEVTTVVFSRGDLVSYDFPLVTIEDYSDIWFVFNVREDLMADFKTGKRFKVSLLAAPEQEYEAEVIYAASQDAAVISNAITIADKAGLRRLEVYMRPVIPIANLRPGTSAMCNFRK